MIHNLHEADWWSKKSDEEMMRKEGVGERTLQNNQFFYE